MSNTIMDRGGNLRVLMRVDNADPHIVDASRRKAYTLRCPYASPPENWSKTSRKTLFGGVIRSHDGFLALDGDVPIKAGDEVIGVVGAGGALDGQFDEACAVKAIEKVQAKLK